MRSPKFFLLPYLFPYLTKCLVSHFCSLLLNLFVVLDFSQHSYLHIFLYELTKAFGTFKVTSRSKAEMWYLAFYKSHLSPNPQIIQPLQQLSLKSLIWRMLVQKPKKSTFALLNLLQTNNSCLYKFNTLHGR